VLPGTLENVERGWHATHAAEEDAPDWLDAVPGEQLVHEDDDGEPEKVPAGHAWQAAMLVAFAVAEKLPAAHPVHEDEPATVEYDPAAHVAHTALLVALVTAE
jgi:hypothetical protein